ncbi:MAG TPA: hypothetical protein VG164_05210 [Trebonia sp.]|jgi:hypothetical protein|nr:hypothetical protein [Trebonia sp.]
MFVAGFAVGFIVGARAGRERYDQLMKAGRQIAEHPAVQKATQAATAKATYLTKTATAKAPDLAKTASSRVPRIMNSARQQAASRMPFGGKSAGGTPAGEAGDSGEVHLPYQADGSGPSYNGMRSGTD